MAVFSLFENEYIEGAYIL